MFLSRNNEGATCWPLSRPVAFRSASLCRERDRHILLRRRCKTEPAPFAEPISADRTWKHRLTPSRLFAIRLICPRRAWRPWLGLLSDARLDMWPARRPFHEGTDSYWEALSAFKKGSGTVVQSTLRAVPATVPDPFLKPLRFSRRMPDLCDGRPRTFRC